jgi:broad specificity phosphatase PhoE
MSFVGLLRHGAVEGGEVYRGRTDDPLSPIGFVRMWEALSGLNQWDLIVSSPLRRCAVFAKEFAHYHGIPLSLEPGLSEIDFGEWEGRSSAELMQTSPTALTEYWRDPCNHTPPGGESLLRFHQRVIETWDALQRGRDGRRLLLVTHGGVIRILLCHLQGWPLERILEIEVKHTALFGLLVTQASLKRLFTSRTSMAAWLERNGEG